MTPNSRKAAILEGAVVYFTGRPCKRGHISDRFTLSGLCRACGNHHAAELRKNRPDVLRRRDLEFNRRKRGEPKWLADTNTSPIDGEVWRTVPGFDGAYEVSSIGRVKSLRRRNCRFSRILRTDAANGTPCVTLSQGGRKTAISVSRLMHSAFGSAR